ncbi:hypothetical protein ARHIZOSPH14_27630 [Agromyces rhizosphaerae]|uniref:Glycosyl transferase family 1 domain-containing protein n=1 Tax=Agromyces rhizosphaerae TaxID=88374 RepID=A0A9W6CYV6_9MICO|nr:glycosyltransferase [Agromyces rhizosphaerae]GLI28521.1 hypothetical protein ARHIZOSPH14_27630 [Agromyces rhizosphaerae]
MAAPHDPPAREAIDRLVDEVMEAAAAAAPAARRRAFLHGLRRAPQRLRSAIGRLRRRGRGDESAAPGQHTLLAFPYWAGNHWQAIMYDDLRRNGWRVDACAGLDDRGLRELGAGDVLHVNWTSPVSQEPQDLLDAAIAVREAIDAMTALQARGGRVVWTVHNVLPHETAHVAPELALLRWLGTHADLVTIMNPHTLELTAGLYPIDPARTVRIAHPSYLGWLPETLSRDQARDALGLADGEIAVAFLGRLRAYKGLDRLLAAHRVIHDDDDRFRLLIAGERGEGFGDDDERMLREAGAGVVTSIGRVPDDEMQRWLLAADLLVLPYGADALNLSLVEVAATFGVPAAVSDGHGRGHLAARSWVTILDDADFAGSLRAAAIAARDDGEVRAAARRHADAVAPGAVSAAFRDAVERLLVT